MTGLDNGQPRRPDSPHAILTAAAVSCPHSRPLLNPIMALLVAVITTRTVLAKGAIPVKKHPTDVAGHGEVDGACSTHATPPPS